MHEMSIALSILDIAVEESAARDDAAVWAIHVRLGVLSGVVKEALVSAFELARECSPFPECRLEVTDVPIVVYCPACEAESRAPSIQTIGCSHCGHPASEVVSGREMEITAMEIDEPNPPDASPVVSSEV
jgi:hydrogenase nickel incorporation protein HypA/HybF